MRNRRHHVLFDPADAYARRDGDLPIGETLLTMKQEDPPRLRFQFQERGLVGVKQVPRAEVVRGTRRRVGEGSQTRQHHLDRAEARRLDPVKSKEPTPFRVYQGPPAADSARQ